MTIKKVRKVVLPVAGMGTRILPATKAVPKEMLTVVDKPLIEYAVSEAIEAGIEQVIFITGRGKSAIANHFDANPFLEEKLRFAGKTSLLNKVKQSTLKNGQAVYIRQTEPLGLGHAVYLAKDVIGDEPFAVILPDVLITGGNATKEMIDAYNATGGNIIGIHEVKKEHVSRYGIMDVAEIKNGYFRAKGMVEKPDIDKAPSTLAAVGRYVLNPSVLDYMDQTAEAGKEIQLTDAISRSIKTTPLYGAKFSGKDYDCGNKLGLVEAIIETALQDYEIKDSVAEIIKRNIQNRQI